MYKLLLLLAIVAIAHGFRPHQPIQSMRNVALRMSDESTTTSVEPPKTETPKTPVKSKSFELVPLEKGPIESAASVTGAFLGVVLGGPVLAALFAAIANYVSKQENESGEAIRGVGKTVIESYNYLNKLNFKYDVTGKITGSIDEAFSKAAKDSEALQSVKTTVDSTTSKLSELDKEFGLVSKGKEVLVAAGTLSDAALDKFVELNNKVSFTDFRIIHQ